MHACFMNYVFLGIVLEMNKMALLDKLRYLVGFFLWKIGWGFVLVWRALVIEYFCEVSSHWECGDE